MSAKLEMTMQHGYAEITETKLGWEADVIFDYLVAQVIDCTRAVLTFSTQEQAIQFAENAYTIVKNMQSKVNEKERREVA